MEKQMSDSESAFAMFKAICNDCKAEINGRTYEITKTTHKKRKKIFAFFSRHQQQIAVFDFSFIDTQEFDEVEKIINDLVLFEGSLISRLPSHWETYPDDYIQYVAAMLGSLSYPFLKGLVGN